jgi:hypothetical protein
MINCGKLIARPILFFSEIVGAQSGQTAVAIT